MKHSKYNWKYIHIDTRDEMIMSGWKLYIYGNSIKCSDILSVKLLDVVERFNLTTKIADESIIKRNKGKNIAWSCCVIYLTNEIFSCNKLKDLINAINNSLRDYNYSGKIAGARSINGKIHYRYDLVKPINPYIGVKYDEYLSLYRGEFGNYK